MNHYYLCPDFVNVLGAQITDYINAMRMSGHENPSLFVGSNDYSDVSGQYVVKNRIAIIVVKGALVSSMLSGAERWGAMTYEDLTEKVEHAVNNPGVDKVLIRFHSPGGAVTGCAEAAAKIDKLSEVKEIWSHCTMATSAAYWLASATNRIISDPAGVLGSIGVIMTHMDFSKYLEEWGVKATHIFSGAHKADGSAYNPLDDSARARYQEDVDQLRAQFVTAISSFRGVDEKGLFETEARTYYGSAALENQLCDDIAFFDDVFNMMASQDVSQKSSTNRKDATMAKKSFSDTGLKAKDQDVDDEKEKKDGKTDDESGSDGADAKVAERNRISAILSCEEAKGREGLAQSLALNSSMSVDEAKQHLQAVPVAEPQKPAQKDALAAAMSSVENPDLSSDTQQSGHNNPLVAVVQKFRPESLRKQA